MKCLVRCVIVSQTRKKCSKSGLKPLQKWVPDPPSRGLKTVRNRRKVVKKSIFRPQKWISGLPQGFPGNPPSQGLRTQNLRKVRNLGKSGIPAPPGFIVPRLSTLFLHLSVKPHIHISASQQLRKTTFQSLAGLRNSPRIKKWSI